MKIPNIYRFFHAVTAGDYDPVIIYETYYLARKYRKITEGEVIRYYYNKKHKSAIYKLYLQFHRSYRRLSKELKIREIKHIRKYIKRTNKI